MPKQLGRLTLPMLASAPAGPTRGELYYDTNTDTINRYNGSVWVPSATLSLDPADVGKVIDAGTGKPLPVVPGAVLRRVRVRNDFTNPRAAGLSGWGTFPANTAATPNPTDTDLGTCLDYVYPWAGPGQATIYGSVGAGTVAGARGVPCVGGQIAFGRMSVKVTGAAGPYVLTLLVAFYDSAGTRITTLNREYHQKIDAPALNTVVVLEGWDKAPTGTVTCGLTVGLVSDPATMSMRMSKAQIVVDPDTTVPVYGDGSSTGWTWVATADQSASSGYADDVPPIRTFWFGTNTNDEVTPRPLPRADELALHQELGANVVRFGLGISAAVWGSLNGPVDWRQSALAPYFDALRAAGLKAAPIIGYVPPWLNGGDAVTMDLAVNGTQWANAWAALLNTWPDTIAAVEFWNEPNLEAFWTAVNGIRYMDMLKVLYPALKAARPAIPVLAGSVAHLQTTGALGVSLPSYLATLYANGLKTNCDAISVHPYPQDATSGKDTTVGNWSAGTAECMKQVRAAKAANADSARKIWITEWGHNTTGTNTGYIDEHQQAQLTLLMRGVAERSSDVEGFLLHTLNGKATDAANLRGYELVETPSLRRKPVFYAVKQRVVSSDKSLELSAADKPGADAYRATTLALTTGAAVAVGLTSEREYSGAMHNNASNPSRINCTKPGRYLLTGNAEFATTNTAGVRVTWIRVTFKDGSTRMIAAQRSGGVTAQHSVSGRVRLDFGEYAELVVYQDSGVTLDLQSGNPAPSLSMDWIGP